MYLYSFICLFAGVVERQPDCFVIPLHYVALKEASMLVLFVIFGGQLSILVCTKMTNMLPFATVLACCNSSFCFAVSRVQSTNWRYLTVPSSLLPIVLLIYFRSLNWPKIYQKVRRPTVSLNSKY